MVKMAPPNKHGICIIHDRLENVFAPHNRTFFEESDRSAIEHTHTHPQIKKNQIKGIITNFKRFSSFSLFLLLIKKIRKRKKKCLYVLVGVCGID